MERDDRYHSGPPEPPARHPGDVPVEYHRPAADPRGPAPEHHDDPWTDEDDQRARANMPGAIRAEDTEPYLALQYVARLFKVAAMVVVVALVAEIVAGVVLEGAGALLPLMAEVIRGVVLASILWGAGDLTLLLIDVGHDVRAARVLLGRISVRTAAENPPAPDDRIR